MLKFNSAKAKMNTQDYRWKILPSNLKFNPSPFPGRIRNLKLMSESSFSRRSLMNLPNKFIASTSNWMNKRTNSKNFKILPISG